VLDRRAILAGAHPRGRGRPGPRHARERLGQLGVPQLEKPVTANELRARVKQVATQPGSPPHA
jgi:hypothetical protein